MKTFLPQTLLQWLLCALVAILIVGTIPYTIVGFRIQGEVTPIKLRNLINSAQNVGDSATLNANSYGEVATATRDTLNKHVAPGIDRMVTRFDSTMIRIESKIELIEPVLIALTNNSNNLSSLLVDTNRRINDERGLLPTTTAMIDSVRILTEQELRQAVTEFALAGRNVRIITESPELQALPGEIAELTQSLNRSAGSVEVILDSTEVTSANLASITGNLNAIADDSAKKVHGLLNPKPAPWYRKYFLTPLREIGGVTYLLIRIANGL